MIFEIAISLVLKPASLFLFKAAPSSKLSSSGRVN